MQAGLRKIRFIIDCLTVQEDGQDLVEYALVVALVSVAAVTSLHSLATKIVAVFGAITSAL